MGQWTWSTVGPPTAWAPSTPDFGSSLHYSGSRDTSPRHRHRRLSQSGRGGSCSRPEEKRRSGEMGDDPSDKKPSPPMQNAAVLACPAPPAETAADAAPAAGGGGGGAGPGVVMVKRAALVACLTCQLCGRLLRDPATITECLHTFCRKCISEEFIDKEICYCPTCNIDLGCAPEEKLRVDHSLLYVRSKIFPFKRRKVEDQEVISPITSPVKRKERSLSSLAVHGPRVSIQKCLTKRRTKTPSVRSLSLGGKDATKKVGGWKPLASHIRVGKDRKSLKLGSEDDGRTGTKSGDPDDGAPSSQAKAKEQLTRKGNLPKKTGSRKVFTLKGKKKRFKAKQPTQKGRLRALWFYLVAAFDQKRQPPLPQLTTKFLRIKDVDLPASFIQKYLMQKHNLSSEAEVELMCNGKTVDPAITLHDLADSWLDRGPKGRVRSAEGAPATGFITTVFYSRPELPAPVAPPERHSG